MFLIILICVMVLSTLSYKGAITLLNSENIKSEFASSKEFIAESTSQNLK